MRVRLDGDKLLLTQVSPEEMKWLEEKLVWWHQEGSLKTIKPGDYVKIKSNAKYKKNKVGKFVKFSGTKEAIVSFDGEELDYKFMRYHMMRVAKETLIFKGKEFRYTLWGMHKLLKREAPFPVELENPPLVKNERLPVRPDMLTGITLYDFQMLGASKCISLKRGLCIVPTGGGKTEIMLVVLAALIERGLLKRGLVIVPSQPLADQFAERAIRRGFPSRIGVIHGARKDLDEQVTVAVINSINIGLVEKKAPIIKLVQECNFLCFDETHHLRSDSNINLARKSSHVEYLLGFSGSPFLLTEPFENSGDTMIWGITGGPIFQIGYDHLMNIGLIAEPIVHFKKVPGVMARYAGRFQNIYDKYIVEDEERNEFIATATKRFVKYNHQVLILVQRLEHAHKIMELIPELKAVCIFGGRTGWMRYEGDLIEFEVDYDQFREQFGRGDWEVMIGSTVMDEGFDIPTVGAVIMAGSGKSRIKNLQRLGRGLRSKKVGKNSVYVLDFMDRGHVYLASHSRQRLSLYEEIKAKIVQDEREFWQKVAAHHKAGQ